MEDEVLVCEFQTWCMTETFIERSGSVFIETVYVHGNIYVRDSRNNMIHVFSKDGVLLRSFGCDSSGTAVWDGPWGICVSGQLVYVTDLDGYNVSVFTTAGDYITSFGQHGKGFGEFNTPVRVLVLCM